MLEEPADRTLSDTQAAHFIEALAAAGDRRAAAETFHAFDRLVAAPEHKRLSLAAYERALWSAPESVTSNLPHARTPLVGRREELDLANRCLREKRLLQIVGPGGIGKSRLALEVARVYCATVQARACWIRVARESQVVELAAAVTRALGLRESGGLDALSEAVADTRTLLVLDACENSPEAVRSLSAFLLERSGVEIILTSRSVCEGLVSGSAVELGPLSARSASAAEPAVRLFAERAIMANPNFAITAENADDVVAVCLLLSGVPLAIEVACGYLAHAGVAELAQRLRRGASGDLTDIVTNTLAWRLQLLPQADRDLFLRLSIFESDFSLADGNALLEDGASCEAGLERLVSAFLLVRDTSERELRFRLLDPVRAFARTHSIEHESRALRAKFAAYAAAFEDLTADRMKELAPTMLAALRFACADEHCLADGLRIVANAGIPLGVLGYAMPALRCAEQLVNQPGAQAHDAYETALEAWSWLVLRCGDAAKSVEINAERIERARRSGNAAVLSAALATSVLAARNIGDLERGRAYAEEAAALARANGDTRTLAKALRGLAAVLQEYGKFELAAKSHEEIFSLGEEAVGTAEYTISLHDYANVLRSLDRRNEAAPLLRRCIARAKAAANYGVVIHAQATLARLSFDVGRIDEAYSLLRETLPLCRHDVNPLTRMYAFEDLVSASLRDGQYDDAAFLLGHIDRTRERVHHTPPGVHGEHVRKIRAAVQSRMDKTAYEEAYRLGRAATLDEAFAILETLKPGTVTIDQADRFSPLSAREREVAQLAAEGRTNREIAQALVVSVRTVDAHMAAIFRKLGIERREHIIR